MRFGMYWYARECVCMCILRLQVFTLDLEEAEDLSGEFENTQIKGCNAGTNLGFVLDGLETRCKGYIAGANVKDLFGCASSYTHTREQR